MKKRAGYKLIALLLCFVLAVCGITAALTVGAIRFAYPMKYENYIEKYSAQYDVPKTLLLAVIKTESSFDPKAESSAGALGLTQITPETFHWLQTKTGETLSDDALSDPETAIRYGALFSDFCSMNSTLPRLPSPPIMRGAAGSIRGSRMKIYRPTA